MWWSRFWLRRTISSSVAVEPVSAYAARSFSFSIAAAALLDDVHHVEDRQVHRDYDQTNDGAHAEHQDGLEDGRQRLDTRVDLVLVEVGDLAEHGVERAGLLAHRDHLRDHGREHAHVFERFGDRLPLLHALLHVDHGLLYDGVAGRLAGDLDGLQNRHAGGDERAQRAREARHGQLAHDLADAHGDTQLDAVPDHRAALGALEAADAPDEGDDGHQHDEPPPAAEDPGDADHDAREHRQLGVAQVLVHAGEDRDEEQHHADEHEDRERADHERVDHRRLDGAADAVFLLELRGEAVEHLVEDTAELAGADHADVQASEHLGVLGERVGEADAGLYVGADLADDLGELLVGSLLLEDVQAAQHREAGVDHGGELPREDGEVLGFDAAADLDLADAALDLVEVEDGEALVAQRGGDGGFALAVGLAGGLRASLVDCLVGERGQRPAAAPTGRPPAGCTSSRSRPPGSLERFFANSRVMMLRRTRSASAASMVCMPNCVPVCMVE